MERIAPLNVNELAFTNPATGERFGQVTMAAPEEIFQAVRAMRAAAREWGQVPVRERARILGKFQEMLLDSFDEITAVLNQDTGKSRQDALAEAMMTVDLLHQYRKYAPRWLRRRGVPRGLFLFKRFYVEPRPYGVVLVIAPWNYPFYLSLPPVLAALLAGNTVLLKPSEITAASGVLIERLFRRVPELAPYVRVLHGDGRVGAELVQLRIEPMVMVDVDHRMQIMQEETFGPIIPIMKVIDEADAIRLANDSVYGLSASVWSNDLKRAERVAHRIQAGSILVNDTIVQIAAPMLPFGGLKQSGSGRIHGREGLLQFTQTYSYAVGKVPNPLDVAVIMRESGHYWPAVRRTPRSALAGTACAAARPGASNRRVENESG